MTRPLTSADLDNLVDIGKIREAAERDANDPTLTRDERKCAQQTATDATIRMRTIAGR